jgi:hypothetical protein
VVLDSDQVIPLVFKDVGNLNGARGVVCRGIEEEAELQVVTVVSHDLSDRETKWPRWPHCTAR